MHVLTGPREHWNTATYSGTSGYTGSRLRTVAMSLATWELTRYTGSRDLGNTGSLEPRSDVFNTGTMCTRCTVEHGNTGTSFSREHSNKVTTGTTGTFWNTRTRDIPAGYTGVRAHWNRRVI